jgi:hypothetical protein
MGNVWSESRVCDLASDIVESNSETLIMGPEEAVAAAKVEWTSRVFEHFEDTCCGCGSNEHLKAKLILAEEAGGSLKLSNSTLLCRVCELAAEIFSREKVRVGCNTRPINFWIDRKLHNSLQNGLQHNYGFNSLAAIVRFLMARYCESPDQFSDISDYIECGLDVKLNVWVSHEMYNNYKNFVAAKDLTVTDSLRGLLRMYEANADRIFGRLGK